MSRAPDRDRPRAPADAGFTLLEVLAAVAVAGMVLSAIGALVAGAFAGIRSARERVELAQAGRSLLASLPQGDALQVGTTAGAFGTTKWRIEVAPAPGGLLPAASTTKETTADPAALPQAVWIPAAIVISATARSGRRLRLETIGLLHRPAP